MALDYDGLLARQFPEIRQDYGSRDTILYALGTGYGFDPLDLDQLRYVYEDGLVVAPTMATVLGHPGFWLDDPATGVDWRKVVHGSQGFVIHRPLRPQATVIGRTRVTRILDKGPKVGALLYSERTVIDVSDGEPVCTLTSITVCRGDGGFGGPSGPTDPPRPIPERAADAVIELPTLPQSALIYRLSGDRNPLHADPAVALAAGYERPILHGLATFGVAGHALLRACCGYDAEALRSMEGRFTAPVYPGDTVATEIWREGSDVIRFRCRVTARDAIVINNGHAEIRG